MPRIEASLPDQIDTEIDHLVEQGEFINRDQAVEELLTMGISAYGVVDDSSTEMNQDMFSQALDDQQDPAMQDEGNRDGRTF